MNIVITNVDYQPQFIGGIKRVSSILGNEWKKMSCNVSFMTSTTSSLRYEEFESIPQFFLPDSNSVNSDENYNFFCAYIKNNNIDVILNQFIDEKEMSELCIRVQKATGCKLVSTLHFSPLHKQSVVKNSFFARFKLGNPIKRYLHDALSFIHFWLIKNPRTEKAEGNWFKYIYDNSTRVVLLSDKFIPIFAEKAKLTESQKLTAINNPCAIQVDQEIFPKKKKIVWCGRLGYDMKRTDKMVAIWKHISRKFPDWELNVLGSGDADYFKRLASQHHIKNINFPGFQDPKPYYQDASILCMTSVTEGWGMVLVEAQSFGCVPIAYNSFQSLSDIITDGENGYTVPAFNEKEYIRKLSALMVDSTHRNEMAQRCRDSVKRFDSQKIAQQWINLFHEIL